MIRLIPADPSLVAIFEEARRDPEVQRFNPLAPVTREQLMDRLLRAGSDLRELGNFEEFFWFLEFDQRVVGSVSLKNINLGMGLAEIAYGVWREHRGNGFAERAVRRLLKDLFAQTTLRKVVAYVHEGNLASRRTLEKIGFRAEGLLREHYLIQGHPANEVLYGLLRGETRD